MMQKLIFKNSEHDDVDLDRPRITIGRDKGNDIVLDKEGVSGFHAEIQMLDDEINIVDLGSTNGTRVNGKKISGKQRLKPQDVLAFDQVETQVIDPSARQKTVIREAIKDNTTVVHKAVESGTTKQTPAVGGTEVVESIKPKLIAVSGSVSGKEFQISGDIASIGRNADNDIVITDSTISGRHARLLAVRGGRWKVEDFGSTNGIKLNNKKVSEGQLSSGDVIHLGNVKLRFDDGQAATVATQAVPDVAEQATRASIPPVAEPKKPVWAYGLVGFAIVAFGAVYFYMSREKPVLNPSVVDNPVVVKPTTAPSETTTSQTTAVPEQVTVAKPAEPIVQPTVSPVATEKQTEKAVAPEQMLTAELQVRKIWTYSFPAGSKVNATPALADVNGDHFLDVILVDSKGFVVVLDGQKGKKMINANVPGTVSASINSTDISGDGDADFIIATDAGDVIALNGEGKTLWKSPGDLNIDSIMNRPAMVDITGDAVPDIIIPSTNKGLVGLDGSRGWKLWDAADQTDGKVVGSPVAADINGDGVMDFISVTDKGQVRALSAKGKKVWQIWKQKISAVLYASPMFLRAGDQGIVVVATRKDGIVTLDAKTGRFLWMAKKKLQKEIFASPIATDANGDGVMDVVVVTRDGNVHVLNGRNGDELWSNALGVKVEATPALFDVNNDKALDLIVLDTSGRLLAMDVQHGRTLLTVDTGSGGFFASPVLGDINNDGLVDIVTVGTSGRIVAYGMNRTTSKGKKNWPIFLGNSTHTSN